MGGELQALWERGRHGLASTLVRYLVSVEAFPSLRKNILSDADCKVSSERAEQQGHETNPDCARG